MLIFATTTVVIQWNVLSFRAGVLLPIDYSIVTFITALGINKAVQKFAESKAPPPVDTLKTETTTKTSETTNTPVQP